MKNPVFTDSTVNFATHQPFIFKSKDSVKLIYARKVNKIWTLEYTDWNDEADPAHSLTLPGAKETCNPYASLDGDGKIRLTCIIPSTMGGHALACYFGETLETLAFDSIVAENVFTGFDSERLLVAGKFNIFKIRRNGETRAYKTNASILWRLSGDTENDNIVYICAEIQGIIQTYAFYIDTETWAILSTGYKGVSFANEDIFCEKLEKDNYNLYWGTSSAPDQALAKLTIQRFV